MYNILPVMIVDSDSVYCYVFQGPVCFDENGAREESRLYIFQYYNRRAYTNRTQTCIDRVHKGDLNYNLSLFPVAYIERDSEDLKFVGEGKNRLWSGKQYFLSQRTILKISN